MNKKFLTVAASLLLALPMTVAAAPSPTTTDTEITVPDGSDVKVGSKEEALKNEQPYIWVEDSNEKNAPQDAASVLSSPVKFAEFSIEANGLAEKMATTVTLTVTLSKPIPSGKVGALIHYSDNGPKIVKSNFTGSTVTFTINTADLSPFVVYIGEAKSGGNGGNEGGKTPNTSDSNKSVLWGSIAMISLACAAGIVVARKRNA